VNINNILLLTNTPIGIKNFLRIGSNRVDIGNYLNDELNKNISLDNIWPVYNEELDFLERFYVYFENNDDFSKIKEKKYKGKSKLTWLSINEQRFVNSYFILNQILKNSNLYLDRYFKSLFLAQKQ
jgi:hypothetical protein